jgi:leader peptidase (prepilin peptidase)/N-methyltransferase
MSGIALAFGLVGLCVGSFLNVVIVRGARGALRGRSACATCGQPLAWYDMVPVLSWIALGARCRTCGAPISIRYPLVEAVTGALFTLAGVWLAGG